MATDYRPHLIARGLIIQNTPNDGGEWVIECDCGERLAFSCPNRGTDRASIVVRHGEGEARLEIPALSDRGFLWSLGLDDPVAEWIDRLHLYEEEKSQ